LRPHYFVVILFPALLAFLIFARPVMAEGSGPWGSSNMWDWNAIQGSQKYDDQPIQLGNNAGSLSLSPSTIAIIAIVIAVVLVALYFIRSEKTPEQALRELDKKAQKHV
jgi:hypothetical protein